MDVVDDMIAGGQGSIPSSQLGRCVAPPSPELRKRIDEQLQHVRDELDGFVGLTLRAPEPRTPGLNDGLIFPEDAFPLGTPSSAITMAALDRAPLRGSVRVIVVLVDFSDQQMAATQQHFNDLFFSTGVVPSGSVKEYFTEASHGLVTLTGQVVGPYRLSQTMAAYANGASGLGGAAPNAQTMARHAAEAANPHVNFAPYDNDANGFVDAFVVVHAGPGAETTGNTGHIWSHKWVLSGGAYSADATKIYGYLTVPEDSRIGVCAHELGHLLFGWPDLYDTDGSSEGIGNWCLMAGGTWNGGGNVPAHPSAWCKINQGWVGVDNRTTNAMVTLADVKDSHTVYRLWKDGGPGSEYFAVEQRQRNRFDAQLPGDGILIWHIDESIGSNTNEAHPKVALMQADGKRQLESASNRGDSGDSFPGSANNTSFTSASNPHSKSYGGQDTCVAVTNISASGATMTARLAVSCKTKEFRKDFKDSRKDLIKDKELSKEIKDGRKEFKEGKEFIAEKPDRDKLGDKSLVSEKRVEKPDTDKTVALDKPFDQKLGDQFEYRRPSGRASGGAAEGAGGDPRVAALEARVAALEAHVLGEAQAVPFVGSELRPDLSSSALSQEDDLDEINRAMLEGATDAKRLMDSKLREG